MISMKILQIVIFLSASLLATSQVIAIPETLNIIRGSCSTFTINPTNVPAGTVLTLSSSASPNQLTINRSAITLNSTTPPQTINVCVGNNTTVLNYPISYSLSGASSSGVVLPTQTTTITVTNSTAYVGTASVSIASTNMSGECVSYVLRTSGPGTVYYYVRDSRNTSGYSTDAVSVKAMAINNSFSNSSSVIFNSFDNNISGVYSWGMASVSGDNTANVTYSKAVEGIPYTICFYYENQISMYSSATCTNVSSVVQRNISGKMMRGQFFFTGAITPQQFNKFLCYLSNLSNGAPLMELVTLDGSSCSASSDVPYNYFYNYNGTTIRPTNDTVVFWSNTCSGDMNRQILSGYNSLWSNNRLSSSALSQMNSSGITFVKDGKYLGEKLDYDMLYRVGEDNNTITYTNSTNNSGVLTISGLRSSNFGVGYFVIVSNTTSQGNNSLSTPTRQQILKCLDSTNNQAMNCSRVVFSNVDSGVYSNVSFGTFSSSNGYRMYYATADEFPRYPVLSNNITRIRCSNCSIKDPVEDKNWQGPNFGVRAMMGLLLLIAMLLI